MFDNLIESRRKRDVKSLLKNSTASVVVHVILISLAIYATLHAGDTSGERVRAVAVTVQTQKQEEKKDEPPPEKVATVDPPPKGFQTLSIPANIPVDIPPPQQNQHFDAADFSGVGVEGGVATGVVGGTGIVTDQPYMEALVEERPEQIANSCVTPRYPELLRQAGIEGRVMLEFVIDTVGRLERNTLRVVSNGGQPGFEAPAREAAMSCRFRPGRIQGRAVRVRVQLPVNFQVNR